MKHLKSFFENNEESSINGVYIDDIKEMFFDIEDEGYSVEVKLVNVFVNKATQNETGPRIFKFELRPQVQVIIRKGSNIDQYSQMLNDAELLFNSDLFRECIEVAKSRLAEYNLEVSEINKQFSSIKIVISEINI